MAKRGETLPCWPAILAAVSALRPAAMSDTVRQRRIDHWTGKIAVHDAIRQNPKRPEYLVPELDSLKRRLDALEQHIRTHRAALANLVKHKHLDNEVLHDLNALPLAALSERVASARAKAIGTDRLLASGSRRKKAGRTPDPFKLSLASLVRLAYRDLTGEAAKVRTKTDDGAHYGPFIDFMKAIFTALEISRGAVSCARRVADRDTRQPKS
jgi:hypothetical protein